MMVGLSVGNMRFGWVGALAPTSGAGLTSFLGGVFKDSHSWASDILWYVKLYQAEFMQATTISEVGKKNSSYSMVILVQ